MDPASFGAAFAIGQGPATRPDTKPVAPPPAVFRPADPRSPSEPPPVRRTDPDDLHAPDPTATVRTLPTPPAGPPPLVVQFHEDAATKGDLDAIADRLERAIKPLDVRLVAVESKVDRAGTDLAALRSRVERVEQTKVSAANRPAAPPKVQLWELYDITGVRCTGHDPDELSRRVQQRDTYFARQAAGRTAYAPPPLIYGGYSAPMSFGGFAGGGCAGGSCR